MAGKPLFWRGVEIYRSGTDHFYPGKGRVTLSFPHAAAAGYRAEHR